MDELLRWAAILVLLSIVLWGTLAPLRRERMTTTEWTVICKPTADDEVSGIVVLLTHGDDDEHVVARVAYDREKSKDPDTPFAVKLDDWILSAREAAAKLNELDSEYELLAKKSRDSATKQIRAILGPKPRANSKPE